MAKRKKTTKPKTTRKPPKKPVAPHPWRLCPAGRHWVREHERQVTVSEKNPDGTTSVEGHCRTNSSHKDQIYPDEMIEIAKKYFAGLNGEPAPDDLGFPNGNAYDDLIRGWTKYWNETLKPDEPLDPDLVKALIASESGFNSEADNKRTGEGRARGLMQVTEQTRKILQNEKGELRDFLLNIDQAEITDPNFNICAGTRWLFRKKEIVERRLGRPAIWRDVLMDYKSYRGKPNAKGMKVFDGYYNRLKKSTTTA